jgi:hypothetical protein
MDPLNALSLAGNVIQFVDFGSKLLKGAGELYRSPSGSLALHDEIEITTSDLRAVIVKLRTEIPQQQGDDTWTAFATICDDAATVADELLQRLSKLKIKDGKHKKLRSIQQAVACLWSENEISDLMQRLSSFRQALETRVLLSIRSGMLLVWIVLDTKLFNTEIQSTRRRFPSLLASTVWTSRASKSYHRCLKLGQPPGSPPRISKSK